MRPERTDSRSVARGEAEAVARLASVPAPWRSGYAAACKAVYTGSIPVGASRIACARETVEWVPISLLQSRRPVRSAAWLMRLLQDVVAAIGRLPGQNFAATRDSLDQERGRGNAHGLITSLAWRLAGILFIGSAAMMVPAILLLGKPLTTPEASLIGLAVGTGVACFAAAERQLSRRWLAVVPLVAVAEMAAMVQATDYVLSYLYFFVALYVAVVFPRPRQMVPYLALIGAALLLRFTDPGVDFHEGALWTLGLC